MKKDTRYVGFDVDTEKIAVAVAEPEGEVRSLGEIPNREESVRRLVPRTIDFETMEWHHHACAPKIPFDSHLKTDRCLRPEFALATAEPTRRVEPGWC
jgi:hypothetical protein